MHTEASRLDSRNCSPEDATGRGAPSRGWWARLLDPAWDCQRSRVIVEIRIVTEWQGLPCSGTLNKGFNRACTSNQSQGKTRSLVPQVFPLLSWEVGVARLGLAQA